MQLDKMKEDNNKRAEVEKREGTGKTTAHCANCIKVDMKMTV